MSSNTPAQYFTENQLELKEVLSGASMWGVALDKTQLTYFEVAPNSRFDTHQHESEQITYVLAGTLHFDIDDVTFSVRPGEVMAVPANVPHAVYTIDEAVKAVDAWSPVNPTYQEAMAEACC